MDALKLEVLKEKRKGIMKQIVDYEFNAKMNKTSELFNNKTVQALNYQLNIIDKMINEENTKIEK